MAKCIDYILVTVLKEKMQEKPLNQITVAELVQLAGVNRKTFYNHFSGVADLLCHIVRKEFEKTVCGRIEPFIWDAALRDFLYDMQENANFIKMILESKYISAVEQCFRKELEKEMFVYVKEFQKQMEESEGTDIHLTRWQEQTLVKFYVALMAALIEEWMSEGMKEPVEEYVEIVKRLSSNGIRAGINFFQENNEKG